MTFVTLDCTILTVVDAAVSATKVTVLAVYIVAVIAVRTEVVILMGVREAAVERE